MRTGLHVHLLVLPFLAGASQVSCSVFGGGDDGDCNGGKCDDLDCDTPGIALVAAFPGTTLKYPVAVKQSPDARDPRFYVVEKGGRILAITPSSKGVIDRAAASEPVLDIQESCAEKVENTCVYRQASGEMGWEEGMLDMAFHPKFPDKPFVYVTYIAGRGDVMIWRLSRFTASFSDSEKTKFRLDAASELVMLSDRKPEDTHNGGSLAVGPDGLLYVSVGDGGGVLSEQAQNTNTIFGSVLRIDVDADCERGYAIPADNPFAAPDLGPGDCNLAGVGGRPELFAWGIRNPWRMSFDRETGDLWEAEVGQDSREEVNLVAKGKNFGYPMLEANLPTPKNRPEVCKTGCTGLAAPEIEIFHEGQAGTPPDAPVGNSVTGGYVYRPGDGVKDADKLAGLEGFYIYGDFMTTEIWAYKKGSGKKPLVAARTGKRVAAFGEDRAGNLYVLDHQAAGALYLLTAGPCQSFERPDNFYAFLSRDGIGSEQDALSYYAALGIDPLGYTLTEWQRDTFGLEVEQCFAAEPPAGCADIVKAYYKNDMDLGFWREMYCSRTIGKDKGGCMVRNWKEEGALVVSGGGGLENLGTVAMSVSPEGFTRFYAFGPDGAISPVAVLDSEGKKAVPNLCTPCHGGTRWVPGAASADIGAIFREFEPSLFKMRDGTTAEFPGINEQQYDKELFDLNQAVLSANRALHSEADGAPADFDKWRDAVIDYIDNGIYESEDPDAPVSRRVTDAVHIPTSWADGGSDTQIAAKEQLWMNVVHPYCMGCHRSNTKNFAEYSNFAGLAAVQGTKSLLEAYTSGSTSDSKRALAFMPQAELMFKNFQAGIAGQIEVDVAASVKTWLQQVINPSGPVCEVSFTVRAPTRPGQDVFIVGNVGTLGDWEPQNGLPLAFQQCTDGSCNLSVWQGSASLLRNTSVEFKAIMLQFNTGGPPTVLWEDALGNRIIDVPDSGSSACEQNVTLEFNQP
jgi:glucose/arabinose dehydrogenase